MDGYPQPIAAVDHVEPVPRRIRAMLGGHTVLDTTRALYLWEWPYYPQYYIPLADVRHEFLVPEGRTRPVRRVKWSCMRCASVTSTGHARPSFSLGLPWRH